MSSPLILPVKTVLCAGILYLMGAEMVSAGDKPPRDDAPFFDNSPISYRQVPSRELCELSERVSERIDETRKALEEWGTVAISGLVLAPPKGTFAVDINNTLRSKNPDKKYDFDHWFTEASKSEGTVEFTERIFNTLAASGTLQLAPEQAALAASLFQKQKVEEQLFQQNLERSRVQRADELETFQQNRGNGALAHSTRIDNAQAAADRARTARVEGEALRNTAAARRAAALQELDAAQATRDALKPPSAANAAARETAQATFLEKQTAYIAADKQFSDSDAELLNRQAAEKTALDSLATAKGAKISAGTLLGSSITDGNAFPTFGQTLGQGESQFAFAQMETPGSSLTVAKTFADAIPNVQGATAVPGLQATDLPKLLGTGEGGAGLKSSFPARARLIDAAGNQIISRIFDFLGDPSAALEFQDKPILMAAGNLGVNPGWRTWQDYDGQVDAYAVFQWRPARQATCQRIAAIGKLDDHIYNCDEVEVARHFSTVALWPASDQFSQYTGDKRRLETSSNNPLVAAVSPLMERQNIDEASSRARQDEIALFLSASLAKSGQKAAGEVFDKYMKMRRLDVRTLSSLPVVNSYGLGGARFGFNITSRLQAVGSVGKPKAAQILEKQNFPILVVFGLSGEDLRPRLVRNGEMAQIWEPYILISQAHSWTRQKKRGDFHQVLRSIAFPGFPGRPMESPSESYRLMNQLNTAFERYDHFLSENSGIAKLPEVSFFTGVARENADFLRKASYFSETKLDIPVETLTGPVPGSKPAGGIGTTVSNVLPGSVLTPFAEGEKGPWTTQIMLAGNNLQDVVVADIKAVKGNKVDGTVEVTPLEETPEGLPSGRSLGLQLKFKDKPKDPILLKLPVRSLTSTEGVRAVIFSPMMTFSE